MNYRPGPRDSITVIRYAGNGWRRWIWCSVAKSHTSGRARPSHRGGWEWVHPSHPGGHRNHNL